MGPSKFSTDHPLESTLSRYVGYDDHVSLNGGDLTDIGRNNALHVFDGPKGVHRMQQKGEMPCEISGLDLRRSKEVICAIKD